LDSSSIAFTFPTDRAAQAGLRAVLEHVRGSSSSRIARRMLYLETVDWRFYRKKARLAVSWEGAEQLLLWRARGGGPYARRPIDRVPEFAWEIPYEDLLQQIEELAGVRRLLPLVQVQLDGRLTRILDGRDKTVVEVVHERATVSRPDAPAAAIKLEPVLRVVPVVGYEARFHELSGKIATTPGVRREEGCLLERALAALALAPSGGEPARSWHLRREMRADEAMKAIFRALFETLRYHEVGVRANVDSLSLHDYRVAVRRTRSGLGQVPGVFPRQISRRFKQGFSWLGERTAMLRDLDVQLLTLPRYRGWVGPPLAQALEPLERELRQLHAAEHRELVAAFDSRRYAVLCAAWSEFLTAPVHAHTTLSNARRPIVSVASERIGRAHERVVRKGEAIDPESAPSDLHQLRIECKKLRYLLEFFSGLYPEQDVDRMVAALKALQNTLGEHQDLTVQRDWLVEIEGRPAEALSAATREAVVLLVRRIDGLLAAKREEFEARFAAFRAPDVDAVVRALLTEPCA
jgi:CHAD domain-containing protein